MKLYLDFIRRQMGLAGVLYIGYSALLFFLIWQYNADSMIYYQISPYAYASDPIDFFFGLLVSIPFAFGLFYLKKNNFLNPVALRVSPQKYIRVYVISTLSLCFCVVFFTNIAGVAFSILIASKELLGRTQNTLSGYILGDMQMRHPLAFGVLWSLQKAGIGVLICLFAQIIAFYIKNLFLVLLLPGIYVILENFFTAALGLSRYSLSTAFILNRLKPEAMKMGNIGIAVAAFILVIIFTKIILGARYERKNSF